MLASSDKFDTFLHKNQHTMNITMKNGYDAVEGSAEELNRLNMPEESAPRHRSHGRGALLLAFIAGIAGTVAYTSYTGAADGEAQLRSVPLLGEALPAPDCSVKECFTSGCPETSPFLCRSNSGCSGQTWQKGSCLKQCTLENCPDDVPSDAATCDGVQCTDEWCKQGQTCGPDVPYQCLDGGSRFGCSADEFAWGVRSGDNVCSHCCDFRTC